MTAAGEAQQHAQKMREVVSTEDKLHAMSRAIEALARAIGDISSDLRRIEGHLVRLK